MTEEEFDIIATDYVNQVLNDVIAEMSGEHDDSSLSNKSDKLSDNDSSSDDDEDELQEEDDEEQKQNQIPTDTSSFGLMIVTVLMNHQIHVNNLLMKKHLHDHQ